jgi:hypothetical protein
METLDIVIPILFFAVSVTILCCFVRDDENYHTICNKKRIDDEESMR